MKRLLTAQEASDYIGIKIGTLYQWKSQGKIQVIKLNGCLRFDREYLDRWIAESTIEPMQN